MRDDEHDGLRIRRTTRDDVPAIVSLASRSLGWTGDQRDRDFFIWKHFENPFGESPGWAAFDGERMVAVRMLMRWEFERGGETLRMVRAVDTATDPDHQGRGLFRRLTMKAVEELTDEGVDAVFNTPNAQSLPGYLKMGWSVLGRPTILMRPGGVRGLVKVAAARTSAEKWSQPATAGVAASSGAACDVGERVDDTKWTTSRTSRYLDWRYSLPFLGYRVVDVENGRAIVRQRRRGGASELAICEWLSDRSDRKAVRDMLASTTADYALALDLPRRSGFLPIPRFGPVVTWRRLSEPREVPLTEIRTSLGDLELF